MTTLTRPECALCGRESAELIEPPRRTLDRGPDPDDDSFNITVILPDVPLCDQHARQVRQGDLHLSWCDDPRCRTYGEVGELSACGNRFPPLVAASRNRRSTTK